MDAVSEYEAKPAVRRSIPLLIGIAGGTGSGKTYSALRMATGIAGGERFCVIDTENGRALHYADEFAFDHVELKAPFKPSRYAAAIEANAGYPVIVVDSTSHSWTGAGGVLEWHDELEGGDARKKMLAWQKPKADHRILENALLHRSGHVILAFRAAPKVDMKRDERGNMVVVPKEVIPGRGLDGWIPESDPRLPYEMDCSFLLMADAPGIPKPIKLPDRLRSLVPLDAPLSESVGTALAAWADGGSSPGLGGSASLSPGAVDPSPAKELVELVASLIDAGTITAAQLRAKVAELRSVSADDLPAPVMPTLTDEEREALLSDLQAITV